jgi:hypothetical protein
LNRKFFAVRFVYDKSQTQAVAGEKNLRALRSVPDRKRAARDASFSGWRLGPAGPRGAFTKGGLSRRCLTSTSVHPLVQMARTLLNYGNKKQKDTNMNTIEIAIPHLKRHLRPEVKSRGGKFQPEKENWILPDNPENRQLVDLIQKPITGPTPEERVKNVLNTTVELLNALNIARKYKLAESGDRIVITSEPSAS